MDLTCVQLRKKLRDSGVKNVSSMKKNELVKLYQKKIKTKKGGSFGSATQNKYKIIQNRKKMGLKCENICEVMFFEPTNKNYNTAKEHLITMINTINKKLPTNQLQLEQVNLSQEKSKIQLSTSLKSKFKKPLGNFIIAIEKQNGDKRFCGIFEQKSTNKNYVDEYYFFWAEKKGDDFFEVKKIFRFDHYLTINHFKRVNYIDLADDNKKIVVLNPETQESLYEFTFYS